MNSYGFRDPIFGPIDLTDIQPVMRHPLNAVQRRVHQLGGVQYLLPGATQKRWRHQAVCTHLWTILAGRLLERGVITKDEVKVGRVGLGTHDCGHWAFSHFMEKMFGKHDPRGIRFLQGPMAQAVEQCGVSVEDVVEFNRRKTTLSELAYDNPIGIDKNEYLTSDPYFALGVQVRLEDFLVKYVDWDRKIGVFVSPEALPALCWLIEHSWRMYTEVYEHPETRVCQRSIQELLRLGTRHESIKQRMFDGGEEGVTGAIGVLCQDIKRAGPEIIERYRRFEECAWPEIALVVAGKPWLVPVSQAENLGKIECDYALVEKSENWSVPRLARAERTLAKLLGASSHAVSIAQAPPARRWRVPNVRVRENGNVLMLTDMLPGMLAKATDQSNMAYSIVVAADEPYRRQLATDIGLQRDVLKLLEEA